MGPLMKGASLLPHSPAPPAPCYHVHSHNQCTVRCKLHAQETKAHDTQGCRVAVLSSLATALIGFPGERTTFQLWLTACLP